MTTDQVFASHQPTSSVESRWLAQHKDFGLTWEDIFRTQLPRQKGCLDCLICFKQNRLDQADMFMYRIMWHKSNKKNINTYEVYLLPCVDFSVGLCSQFLDDNDDAESQKFLSNGMMKKKKYEEYHEEYVRSHNSTVFFPIASQTKVIPETS